LHPKASARGVAKTTTIRRLRNLFNVGLDIDNS
jgi:hypothetical protein